MRVIVSVVSSSDQLDDGVDGYLSALFDHLAVDDDLAPRDECLGFAAAAHPSPRHEFRHSLCHLAPNVSPSSCPSTSPSTSGGGGGAFASYSICSHGVSGGGGGGGGGAAPIGAR